MWEPSVVGLGLQACLARAGNCRRNTQRQGVRPEPAPWGKPGSAEWAGEASGESEEEPFQEGGKQAPRQDSALWGAGNRERMKFRDSPCL